MVLLNFTGSRKSVTLLTIAGLCPAWYTNSLTCIDLISQNWALDLLFVHCQRRMILGDHYVHLCSRWQSTGQLDRLPRVFQNKR